MTTFDQILPVASEVLMAHSGLVIKLDWLLLNRDLNSRVRLIAPVAVEADQTLHAELMALARSLAAKLGPHAYPPEVSVLFEESRELASEGGSACALDGFSQVWVVDRLATEADWARIAPESNGAPRVVFFSIKGGVGRSTALAATAWHLAQSGKRVLVLDLDLESPGLSSALLPTERQPTYGIADWLVEDLVDNAAAVFDDMIASSNLSHDGEILVVPAHGAEPGEYLAKLGRAWMPKLQVDGRREPWSARLLRLLGALEARIQPDVVLIDSRSGLDEIASACVTDMGARLILLFALEGDQTWNGYRMLFEQWLRAGVAKTIRERLQVVGAMVPELDRVSYQEGLREHAYQVFLDTLYDEIAPAAAGPGPDGTWQVGSPGDEWSFDEADETAPHTPWAVNWHRSFAGLRSLQGRLALIDSQEVQLIFGPLLDGVGHATDVPRSP